MRVQAIFRRNEALERCEIFLPSCFSRSETTAIAARAAPNPLCTRTSRSGRKSSRPASPAGAKKTDRSEWKWSSVMPRVAERAVQEDVRARIQAVLAR